MKHYLQSIAAAGLFFSAAQHTFAQTNNCGTEVPTQQWEAKFQELLQQNTATTAGKTQAVVYTIPVIIHVIHGGQAIGTYPNLAQGQLNSQIQVLNNDYAGVGLYSGNYPATAFSGWAAAQNVAAASLEANGRVKIANCNVQFCLATQDTAGNLLAEPGIDRVNYVTRGWANPFSFNTSGSFKSFIDGTVKPQTIWNVTKYLNIWVTDENISASGIGGLLGYATFPPLSTLSGMIGVGTNTTDGFWCYAKVFGSVNAFPAGNYYNNTYNKGRTCTHEIGHWLGLRHIWGDAACANDYCADTPPAAASNAGAPGYPYHPGTCTGNSPEGEMYMNFMDYTNDNGKYMFTTNQADRIQTAMLNSPYRKLMGTHGLCVVPSVAVSSSFSMNAVACEGISVPLNNTSFGSPVPSYTWSATGNAIFSSTSAISPTVSFATPGTYTVTLSANNGTMSSATQVITINAAPVVTLSTISHTVCSQEQVSVTASGANYYSWSPGSTIGSVLTFVATADRTYTCSATGTNGCKSKAMIGMTVAECTGIGALKADTKYFSIYPNPASDALSLEINIASDLAASIEMTDISGKIILQQVVVFNKSNSKVPLDISGFENGLYILKLYTGTQTQVIKFVKR